MLACQENRMLVVDRLLELGVNVNEKTKVWFKHSLYVCLRNMLIKYCIKKNVVLLS